MEFPWQYYYSPILRQFDLQRTVNVHLAIGHHIVVLTRLLCYLGSALQANGYFLFRTHVYILNPACIWVFLFVVTTLDKGKGYNGQADEYPDFPTSSSQRMAL